VIRLRYSRSNFPDPVVLVGVGLSLGVEAYVDPSHRHWRVGRID